MESQQADDSRGKYRGAIYFLLPVVVYAVIAVPMAVANRERINPDAVAYIRRGMYLAGGDFYHSLSGYWSPLISWCVGPLVAMGMDGLHAARVVMCVWGAVWVMAVGVFLGKFEIPRWVRLVGEIVLAVFIAPIAARQITPDILMGSCLLIYFAVVVSRDFTRRPGLQVVAGLVGGFCFLAKSYALPFVLLHLPMTIVLRRVFEGRFNWVAAMARGVVGVLVFAMPWILILSWRFGHLTISTAGAHAHTDVGPVEVQKKIPQFFGRVEDPYITRHEAKESIVYPRWSPFESRKYFVHQVRVAKEHAVAMVRNVGVFDRFYLSIGAGVVVILSLLGVKIGGERWKMIWVVLTILLYSSGMLLVFFTARYLMPVWAPLGMVLALMVGMNLARFRMVCAGAVLVSFGVAAGMNLANTEGPSPEYRKVAAELKRRGIVGAIASADRQQGMFVAFFAEKKFLGFPHVENPAEAENQLMAERAGALLIFRGKKGGKEMEAATRLSAMVTQGGDWKMAFEYELGGKQGVEVYVPVSSERTTR